jgi:predicted phage terminase large subunit-like protein
VIEPEQPYVHGWHIDFICAHLEAITRGEILDDGTYYNRLLINVPPGTMKSLLVGVFWPAWEWGPQNMPSMRYVCTSHSLELALRDSLRMRRLVTDDWYQGHWGDTVKLVGDQNAKGKFETTATGSRQACAFTSVTGYRGDRILVDDCHSVDDANSDAKRTTVTQLFKEAVTSRLNNPDKSAIVVVMQRLHELDVSGVILDGNMGYDHIMLPMRYDPMRANPTMLGYEDPREEDGELLFPDRFPEHVVDRDEAAMGPYATAGQYAQSPEPRGGGIVQDSWWQLWDRPEYPPIEYIVASLDTAYTIKAENDPSALTIWGVFGGSSESAATRMVDRYGRPMDVTRSFQSSSLGPVPKAMMMYAWQDKLEVHDLTEKVAEICKKMKVDVLLIENKAAGHSVAQEIRRLFGNEDFVVQMYDPKTLDKVARLYSVQHIFSEGMVYAPNKDWAEMVIRQVSSFPRGKHDDLCLIAGTMITMEDGSHKSIESIVIGDVVKTPVGPRPVMQAGFTGICPVFTLNAGGRILTGTGSHPIATTSGWKRLDTVTMSDTVKVEASEYSIWPKVKALSLAARSTIVILTASINRIRGIFKGQVATVTTEQFGVTTMERFQMVTTSTTKMEIGTTMTSQILNACQDLTTAKSISNTLLGSSQGQNNWNIWPLLGKRQPCGTSLMRAKNGTAGLPQKLSFLAGLLKQPLPRKGQSNLQTLLSKFALNAVRRLRLQLVGLRYAEMRVPVAAVTEESESVMVYNLSVEGARCYYANNILVHNCDTVSMALKHLRDVGMLTRAAERMAEIESDKQFHGNGDVPLYNA